VRADHPGDGGYAPDVAPAGGLDEPGDGLADDDGHVADGAYAAASCLAYVGGERQPVSHGVAPARSRRSRWA